MARILPQPSLRELLDDPVIHVLMARDGVHPDEVRRLMEEVRRRLDRRTERMAA